jgi:hypothetical protein
VANVNLELTMARTGGPRSTGARRCIGAHGRRRPGGTRAGSRLDVITATYADRRP